MATLAGQTPITATDSARALTVLLDRLDEDAEDRARIDLLKFTLDRVALAIFRAMTSGTCERIEAPDEETARLLRRTLDETAEGRPTDRLVDVVVAEA